MAKIIDSPLDEVMFHYKLWTEDSDKRRTRKNGWNDITDAWWGKLPDDWPYDSRTVDPVLRTSVIEKDARLLNSKLRGRLVPREGSDVIAARINNALLDFQWDNANNGGTMLEKWKGMSQDSRLYASSFGLVTWKYKKEEDEILFEGNELEPLDIRNCGMDMDSTHVRNAKWFQVRSWDQVEDLEKDSKLYPGLAELKSKLPTKGSTGGDKRETAYENRILQLKGLQDRVGSDRVFPTVEIITEYRPDRWITFSPKYKVILRDIENPYEHHKIPVIQLRYYKLTGDPLGESEVEPVLPLWRAIQATLNGYLDTMNIHMKPPLKILDGQVRIETIVFGPEAQWLMDRQDSVMEYQGSSQPMALFQTTYAALKQAFNNAMGDISQGISNLDLSRQDKTATEVNQSAKQQNARDQSNQNTLAEAIEDMMSMWVVNNKQFLFADPDRQEYILKIIGTELFSYFKKAGLDQMEVTPEAMATIGDIIKGQDGNLSDDDIDQLIEAGKTPKYPIYTNKAKTQAKPKMQTSETGDSAEISIVPEDIDGNFDYIADVKSMALGAGEELQKGLDTAIQLITGNPVVMQMFASEGIKPKLKDLIVAKIEQSGINDAERFFETQQLTTTPQVAPQLVNGQGQAQGQPEQGNQPMQPIQEQRLPGNALTYPIGA